MRYFKLVLRSLLSFISMYILLYLTVDSYSNTFMNLNQFYMASVLTLSIIIIELLLMGSSYPNKKLNNLILFPSGIIFILLIIFARKQVGINDEQFLRSMIPHHAIAVLMCQHSHLKDPDIQKICKNISAMQLSEIDVMKSKLKTLEK
ncbi:DUF305 domain-containing protein [Candidatus Dependentiae bacterium]|nr:DUF305 domain-containing protein [Candidatus Dependentiae bacterium]